MVFIEVLQRTWNQNIPVVSNEIFNDAIRAVKDVNISPVDPRVIRFESRVEQVVAGATDSLAARALSSKGVPVLDVHLDISPKVLLHNCRATESNLLIHLVLDPGQLSGKNSHGVVTAITNEESQVNEVVRVRQLVEEIEVVDQMFGCVSQRGEDEHPLRIRDGLGGRLDGVEVDGLDARGVHFVGSVMVEEDRGLCVRGPLDHFVDAHLHRRF